jgi:hypothetical protein
LPRGWGHVQQNMEHCVIQFGQRIFIKFVSLKLQFASLSHVIDTNRTFIFCQASFCFIQKINTFKTCPQHKGDEFKSSIQCVHWGRLKSFCLFHGPGRSVDAQDGGKFLMTLGLLINMYYIVQQIFFFSSFFTTS